jgi:raffinose/stachyose/melibiose transport system permease protein
MISRRDQTLGYVILGLASLTALLPLVGVIILALGSPSTAAGGLSLPSQLHFSNFASAFNQAGFGPALRTSAIMTVAIVVISVVLSVPAGYAFALMRFRGRSLLFYLMVFGLLIPIEAILIPLYFDLRRFNLTGSYWSVILPDVAFSVAFGAFWMRAFFLSSSQELMEAARLDGANSVRTLWHVLLPLARPQVLTLAVLFFVWNWNDFLLPLVMLTGSTLQTAPISLVFFEGQHTTNYTFLAAASLITVAPVVLVFVLLQRSFTRGMLAGALKE